MTTVESRIVETGRWHLEEKKQEKNEKKTGLLGRKVDCEEVERFKLNVYETSCSKTKLPNGATLELRNFTAGGRMQTKEPK
jgi:hypothetical protein